MLLENRIAIVTGGSSGIGRGIAIEFAREGARVVVTDIQEAPNRGKYHEQNTITPTVDEIEKLGAQGLFVKTDIADDVQVGRLIQKTVEHFGGLDILENNCYFPAGGTYFIPGKFSSLKPVHQSTGTVLSSLSEFKALNTS